MLGTALLLSCTIASGWELDVELDASALVAEGGGIAVLGASPALPQLRLGLSGERRTSIFGGLSSSNVGWKLTFPLMFEGVVEVDALPSLPGVFVGLRGGYAHFHADRLGVVGLAEEDWYGATPLVGWRGDVGLGFSRTWDFSIAAYVKTWVGYTLPIFRSATQAEIDVADEDRTYNPVPAGLRAVVAFGVAFGPMRPNLRERAR